MRDCRHVLLLGMLALIATGAAGAPEGAKGFARDLVSAKAGSFVYEDLALCELRLPSTSTRKFQVRSRATAPASGLVSRDRFVALVTQIETEIAVGWAEAGAAIRPSQALHALHCEPLQEPIGQVDIEITTTMTHEGMQTEVRNTASGKVERLSATWRELFRGQ